MHVVYSLVHGMTVEIIPSYDPPSTFTLSPPSYRAASPLSLTCEVQGLDGYSGLFYQWQSTCSGTCFVKTGFGRVISTPYLHSYDTGVHTCVVHSGSGILGSASISINVVGKTIKEVEKRVWEKDSSGHANVGQL